MSSGCVLGTISTTSCEPRLPSSAASLALIASVCCGVSVPVWSITRPDSGGTSSTSCACTSAASASSAAASRKRHRRITGSGLLRRRLLEAHRRRLRDLRLVLHGEVLLHLVAEQHGRQVAREAACEHVVLLHRLDVAPARHGDAVLGAFELHAQVL